MGWDVSFHPISKEQLNTWYFSLLKLHRERNDNTFTHQKIVELLDEHYDKEEHKHISYKEEDLEQYIEALNYELDGDDSFDTTHAYFSALVQGFYHRYYYARNTAFSFLLDEDPSYFKYVTPWYSFVDYDDELKCENKITENYCGGCFIDYENVCKLLDDYEHDEKIKSDLDKIFRENICIYLKALNHAKEHKLGLLEATEIIEIGIPSVSSYSNIDNLDEESIVHYNKSIHDYLNNVIRGNK